MKMFLTIALLSVASFAQAQNTTLPKAETMQQHHQQMQRIMQENDQAKRQALWEAHMSAMNASGCPMMSAGSSNHGMHHNMMLPKQ